MIGTQVTAGSERCLLTVCTPWTVAVPLTIVRRLVSDDDANVVASGGGGAWLGQVAFGTETLPAWDLGRLLGLAGGGETWILIDQPLPAALRVSRCLQVTDVAPTAVRTLPALAGGPAGLRAFLTADGQNFGLLADPAALLPGAA
jgi:hypothetical protein